MCGKVRAAVNYYSYLHLEFATTPLLKGQRTHLAKLDPQVRWTI